MLARIFQWTARISLFLWLLFAATNVSLSLAQSRDAVLLSDVKVLTLYSGKMTTGRRSAPVPQIKCVGGSACSEYTPPVIQCVNQGSDGYDIQWKCSAEMEDEYTFGQTTVTCEGYSYPDDPYILKGSCGVEYTLMLTKKGEQNRRSKSYWHNDDTYSRYSSYSSHSNSSSGWTTLFWLLAFGLIIYGIINTCGRQHAANNNYYGNPSNSGYGSGFSGGPGGGYPGGNGGSYGPGCAPTSSTYGMGTGIGTGTRGGGPGFWTGLGTGGLLGWMFGRGTYNRGYNNYYPRNTGFFGRGGGYPTSGSSGRVRSSSTPSVRTSSGYGGTSRR